MSTAVDVVPWWHQAACRGMDLTIFFPARTRSLGLGARAAYAEAAAEALAVCDRCEVVEQCRADIRRHERTSGLEARDGVWAATTPYQRWETDRRPPRAGGRAWRGQRDRGEQ